MIKELLLSLRCELKHKNTVQTHCVFVNLYMLFAFLLLLRKLRLFSIILF